MRNSSRGFTLIELLVVIAIIGVLSSVILSSLNTARMKARDAQRKESMHQIDLALQLYYTKYGSYPSTGATSPIGGMTFSTQANWLQPLVTDKDLSSAPVDPINIDQGPWCYGGNNTRSTLLMYSSDGTHFIICGWLESDDHSMLQYTDVPNPWLPTQGLRANYNYSNYETVIAR